MFNSKLLVISRGYVSDRHVGRWFNTKGHSMMVMLRWSSYFVTSASSSNGYHWLSMFSLIHIYCFHEFNPTSFISSPWNMMINMDEYHSHYQTFMVMKIINIDDFFQHHHLWLVVKFWRIWIHWTLNITRFLPQTSPVLLMKPIALGWWGLQAQERPSWPRPWLVRRGWSKKSFMNCSCGIHYPVVSSISTYWFWKTYTYIYIYVYIIYSLQWTNRKFSERNIMWAVAAKPLLVDDCWWTLNYPSCLGVIS